MNIFKVYRIYRLLKDRATREGAVMELLKIITGSTATDKDDRILPHVKAIWDILDE